MSERKDVTTEPTPGTAAARLVEQSEAEVHAPLTSPEGKWALAWATDRIEGAGR